MGERVKTQRKRDDENECPLIVNDALPSSGSPLGSSAHAFIELHNGHDFSKIPAHTHETTASPMPAVNLFHPPSGQALYLQRKPAQSDSSLSFELEDAPKMPVPTQLTDISPSEMRVIAWLREHKGEIENAERTYHIDRRAIAGAIAWEALENQGPSLRAVGPGKVHYKSGYFSEGDPVAKQAEDAGYLPKQTLESRKNTLKTSPGSIRYIAGIMASMADAVASSTYGRKSKDPAHYDIRCNPPILTNLYQGPDLKEWKKKFASKAPDEELKPGNKMGVWVGEHLQLLEEGVGKPEIQECISSGEVNQDKAVDQENKTLMRKSDAGSTTRNDAIKLVSDVLQSEGHPLDDATRDFMEPRFGHNFSQVRVHVDGKAAESARAVHALAYTVGQDVVFGAGQYNVETTNGLRLLAHELAHVRQEQSKPVGGLNLTEPLTLSGPSSEQENLADQTANHVIFGEPSIQPITNKGYSTGLTINRQAIDQGQSSPEAPMTESRGMPDLAVAFDSMLSGRLEDLLWQIEYQSQETYRLRGEVDALPSQSSEQRSNLETELDTAREILISFLEERIALLDKEINSTIASYGPNKFSSLQTETLDREWLKREGERRQHEAQLRPLRRWQMKREITSIDDQMAGVDQELAELSSIKGSDQSSYQHLALHKAELQKRKSKLATALTSTAKEYEQRDPRWGERRYGQSDKCETIKKHGCGPTSLAIVLNYLYQEDPESLAASGEFEIVTPDQTAEYAATHGRVCGAGTAGNPMVTQVHTQWPGFRGRKISLTEATNQLRNGTLVVFLCHTCTGQNQSGGDRTYGGHFMVLNGVNADATIYNVLDPGDNETTDIFTISQQELQRTTGGTGGFWIVEPK